MCAIAGLMGTVDLDAFARLEEMLHVQRHRGPDGSGMLHDGEIVIVWRF